VVIDETTIEVDLPPDFIGRASDLYVAVASADLAQRTASLPIVSQRPEATRDPAALYAPGELVLTEASGNVAWGENAQKIEVEGLGLEPGTMFELTSGTLTQLVPATAGSPSQSGSPGVQGVAIAVPATFNTPVQPVVSLTTADPQALPAFGRRQVDVFAPIEIPLGGRMKFSAYRLAGGRVEIGALLDPSIGRLNCVGNFVDWPVEPPTLLFERRTKLAVADFSVAVGAPNFPSGADPNRDIPLVERETNRCDPDAQVNGVYDGARGLATVYLRGARLSAAAEVGTITVSYSETSANASVQRQRSIRFRVVRPKSMGALTMDQDLMEAVVDAASWSGVPPQFLKAQAAQETGSPAQKANDPRVYRYEPTQIDFKELSGPRAETATNRAKALYANHLYGGLAISPARGSGAFSVCAAATGNCGQAAAPDLRVAAGATSFLIATQGGRTLVYQDTVMAQPTWQAAALTRIDPPHASFVNGALVKDLRTPSADQFAFDPSDNTVLLGSVLNHGQGIVFSYSTVNTVSVPAGPCALDPNAPPASDFDKFANPDSLTFKASDPMAMYFLRNQERNPGGKWLIAEEKPVVSFVLDPTKKGKGEFKGVLNSEFYAVQAQYLAAGSYGPFHATTFAFDNTNRLSFLDRSGLEILGPGSCVWQVRPKSGTVASQKTTVRLASRLVSAHHTYSRQEIDQNQTSQAKASQYSCSQTPCDQIDFARRWSRTFRLYNFAAPDAYRIGCSPAVTGCFPSGLPIQDRDVNWIGHRAIVTFDVGKPRVRP